MTEAFFIMAVQASLTFVIFACIANWYIAPALARHGLRESLTPLLLLHSFRIVPLMLLLPGQLGPGFPPDLARTIAYGDFAAGVLAFLAVLAFRRSLGLGRAMTWAFSMVSTVDMVIVLTLALRAQVWNEPLGFIYVIPTFYVPVLVVTQGMIFLNLLKSRQLA